MRLITLFQISCFTPKLSPGGEKNGAEQSLARRAPVLGPAFSVLSRAAVSAGTFHSPARRVQARPFHSCPPHALPTQVPSVLPFPQQHAEALKILHRIRTPNTICHILGFSAVLLTWIL